MAEKITSMQDAIGHPLEKGDYVTAVWANGDVALFQVVDFAGNIRTRKFRGRADVVMLKRAFSNNGVKEETHNKVVKKQLSQVTWVDPNYVMLHIFAK